MLHIIFYHSTISHIHKKEGGNSDDNDKTNRLYIPVTNVNINLLTLSDNRDNRLRLSWLNCSASGLQIVSQFYDKACKMKIDFLILSWTDFVYFYIDFQTFDTMNTEQMSKQLKCKIRFIYWFSFFLVSVCLLVCLFVCFLLFWFVCCFFCLFHVFLCFYFSFLHFVIVFAIL